VSHVVGGPGKFDATTEYRVMLARLFTISKQQVWSDYLASDLSTSWLCACPSLPLHCSHC